MSDDTSLPPQGRERLIEAAIRLFGRDGFDATSVRAVAEEAGVSWGLIRCYFGSKEGLRAAAEQRVVSSYIDSVIASAKLTRYEELETLIEARSGDLSDIARFLRRAIIDERPIGVDFVRGLIEASADDLSLRGSADDVSETWMADPIRKVATRIGYLLVAPHFEALLGRNVFGLDEIKRRNMQESRIRELIALGLAAEKSQKPG